MKNNLNNVLLYMLQVTCCYYKRHGEREAVYALYCISNPMPVQLEIYTTSGIRKLSQHSAGLRPVQFEGISNITSGATPSSLLEDSYDKQLLYV